MDNKNNDKKNIRLLTIIVAIVVLLLGTTFSYWRWSTLRNEETNISLIASGSSQDLYARINGNVTVTNADVTLLPTNDCTGPAALQKVVNITYKNGTSQLGMVMAQLDVTGFHIQSGRNLTDNDLSHIHWAITLDANSCSTDVVSSGTFSGITFSNGEISNMVNDPDYGYIYNLNDGDFMIPLPMDTRMQAEATSQNYYVYVWIDENYIYTNYGNVITDPMNDIEFTLEWHGKVKQVLCGDVNLNGELDEEDTNIVLRNAINITQDNYLRTILYFLGDVDADGMIDSVDAWRIANAVQNDSILNSCRGLN